MTYSIKNWNDFQHYSKRNPPWIKLHKRLLDDPEFHKLSGDASKTLAMCWLVASENNGNLPDINTLAFRLRLDSKLLAKHLIELKHWVINDDGAMLARCSQDAMPETETETETEKKEKYSKEKFEDLYLQFPRHEGKAAAEKSYQKIIKEGTSHEIIAAGLERFRNHIERNRIERKFIPLPATWLNGRRWEDEYIDSNATTNSSGNPIITPGNAARNQAAADIVRAELGLIPARN